MKKIQESPSGISPKRMWKAVVNSRRQPVVHEV